MMVFSHSADFKPLKQQQIQIHPVDYQYSNNVSQKLLEAAHRGDTKAAMECIADSIVVDVNFVGAVCFKGRKAEVVLKDQAPDEVKIEFDEYRTDVTPLFLASHSGNLVLVKKLLSVGADVNQKLFRGYATTAAVREGRTDVLMVLLKAGAGQPACEEALIEASFHGRAKLAELLMGSDLIQPNIAIHALVTAASRGFVDVLDTLIKCGVDANATDRVLLRSLKPSLHTNTDCTALVAAIVTRQVAVVRHLLQVGVRKDIKVSLGAWSWDPNTGEEFRVGAGLSDPYNVAWCAVEYFESTGTILRLLLNHYSPNTLHLGRSLLHHSILCSNPLAFAALLSSGADFELPIRTTSRKTEFRPIHMAARLGQSAILQCLIDKGCDINSKTESGDTALMLSAKYKREECVKVLVSGGADMSLLNNDGNSVALVADLNQWGAGFNCAVLSAMSSGAVPKSSNLAVFSPIIFVAGSGNVRALEIFLMGEEVNIDEQDKNGFSPLMIAAKEGHVDSFRLLVFAGANVKLTNNKGETAIDISQLNKNSDLFEQVMLDFALEKGNAGGFYALHCAARRGDLAAVRLLTTRGFHDVNLPDGDGYTPLMLAAREGYGKLCEILIACGAKCDIKTERGETALSLARKNLMFGNEAEGVILDELARILVLGGGRVRKHTKRGKGRMHVKVIRMVEGAGVLRWGKSSRRNVTCKEASLGGSLSFQRNRMRKKKGDAFEPGLFRVVTSKGKEFHFVCEGGDDMAELWVRGIQIVTKAVCG